MTGTPANIDGSQGPVGPLKHVRNIATNADFEDPRGFIAQAVGAGNLTYVPFAGDADVTDALEAGGFPNVAGIPVLCRAIRAASTVATVRVGYL